MKPLKDVAVRTVKQVADELHRRKGIRMTPRGVAKACARAERKIAAAIVGTGRLR